MKKIYIPPETNLILIAEELQPVAASPTGSGEHVTPGEGGGGNGTEPPSIFSAKSVSPHSSRPFFDDDYPDNAEEMYE